MHDYSHNIRIYNSIKKKKELFIPINKSYIGIYVCGPTVYRKIHLGNCRTFIYFDVVFRYLKSIGFNVRYVRNITDVGHLENDREDKIYNKARIEDIEPMEIAQKYTLYFHNILNLFNTLPPSIEPIASGHIIEQIDLINKLIDKGVAYKVNGSVYFDVKFYNNNNNYGLFSNRFKIANLLANRIQNKYQIEKKNPHDFALWKIKNYKHIMKWSSPWGYGFPGWHIECTAMSIKYIGDIFDIHGGGIDLKFPHHECEIAQFKSVFNKNIVSFWMHTNILTLNGNKMSKSTGNVLLPNEIINGKTFFLKRSFSPYVIRFFF